MPKKPDQSWNENRLVFAMEGITTDMHRGGAGRPDLIDLLVRESALKAARRRPPEGGLAMPVEPPRGPAPISGGAAAPLEFD
ncbi:MAG: hypothetical protein AAFP79_12620 [Pseudomonadota bacterium]